MRSPPEPPARRGLAAAATLLATVLGLARADVPGGGPWPAWRGDGSGISGEPALPVAWTTTNRIVWRTPLPGEGSSSPVVWDQRVFVTASTDGGRTRLVLCLGARDGRIRWQRSLSASNVPKTDPKSGYAPATPATDGKRVYAFFDSPGLVALDFEGRPLWTVALGPFDSPYNVASSPIVFRDQVIQCCDHGGDAFILAVEGATGRPRWRAPRTLGIQFSTPLLIQHRGAFQVVVSASTVKAYDPLDGRELWSCGGLNAVVAPSPVYAHGLVYAASGRNGPALALDPGGRGDVKESHVRLHVPSGGPYVPSPLVLGALLVLPGDDGVLRFINARGQTVLTERLRAHFTASPVIGGGHLYWTAENGDTFVLDVSRAGDAQPAVRRVAVNPLGETCLASPAVAGGALFIRTVKALYCIAGRGEGPAAGSTLAEAADDVAALKRRFEDHPAAEGDDVPVRLAVVDALAQLKSSEGTAFLAAAALKDPQWDVSEAAAKAVAGAEGPDAVAGLLGLLADSRPYLKVIGAGGLGRLRAVEAVPALLAGARGGDPLVRIACLQALATIGAAGPDVAGLVDALITALSDREGTVKAAALRGLAQLAGGGCAEADRGRVIPALLAGAADSNPVVAAAALEALEAFGWSAERRAKLMDERVLYGGARAESVATNLAAGPIRLKFQDGELRYLYVGDREIVRRAYFAVRDQRYDTVMPEFSRIEVRPEGDGFTVRLEARCRGDTADYRWAGEIAGSPEGRITFRVEGQANRAFPSPRIGLNVLFGTPTLAGQAYETTDATGAVSRGVFPADVVPGLLTAVNLTGLRYTAAGGLQVSCSVTGGTFGVEDQRNFCDTSYKAFHSLGYPPQVPTGAVRRATLAIEVRHAPAAAPATGPVRLAVVKLARGAKLPAFGPADAALKPTTFAALNGEREKWRGATNVCWAFNPAAHLPDDDTFMENVPAIGDQVRTVRSLAARAASLRIDPVGFDSPHPRPARDPRNRGLFGAAWLAAMAGSLAAAGVEEAGFAVGPGPATELQQDLAAHAGRPLLILALLGPRPLPVSALGVQAANGRVLWLVNQTDQPQPVEVAGLPKRGPLAVRRLNLRTIRGVDPAEGTSDLARGAVGLTLLPYEVCRLTIPGRQ